MTLHVSHQCNIYVCQLQHSLPPVAAEAKSMCAQTKPTGYIDTARISHTGVIQVTHPT